MEKTWQWNKYVPNKLTVDDMRVWVSDGPHRENNGINPVAINMRINYLRAAIQQGIITADNRGRVARTLENLRRQL